MLKKVLTAVAGTFLLVSATGFAAGINYTMNDIDSCSLTVSGTVPYSSNQPWVTVSILNPGYGAADGTASVNCIKQTTAVLENEGDKEGSFSVGMEVKNPVGATYKIRVNYYGAEAVMEKEFSYYTSESLSALCGNIVAARNNSDTAELKALLGAQDVLSFLGVRASVIKDADFDKVCEMLVSNKSIKMEATVIGVRQAYEEAANILILNSDKAEAYIKALRGVNKDLYADVIKGSFESKTAYEVFAQTEEKIAEEIINVLCKSAYDSGKDFNEKFEFEVLSCIIKNAESYLEVRKVMSSYKDVFETSWQTEYDKLTNSQKTEAETALLSAVKKGGLNSTDDIGNKFISCIKDAAEKKQTPKPSGGGGGGGGSSKGSSSSVKVEVPLVQEIKEEASVNTEIPFVDLENVSWAVESISYLSEKGVISGKSKMIFEPDSNVTREEFIKMVVLAFEIESDEIPECNFEDVLSSDWFKDYVSLGVKFGIVNGINDMFFGSGMNITRQDIAVMLCRAAEYKGIDLSGEPKSFTDNAYISDYAKDAVKHISAVGAAGGDENGNFNPQSYATRAEAAKMIYSMIKSK